MARPIGGYECGACDNDEVSAEPMVRIEARDHVLLIAMNRPDKRNAIDQRMADELSAAFDTFDAEPVFRVAVLTGTSRVFSAGTDMKEPRSPATPNGGEYGLVRRERRKPVIAAVEGVAFGGGFELVLACDLVVASTTAQFGLHEVNPLAIVLGAAEHGVRDMRTWQSADGAYWSAYGIAAAARSVVAHGPTSQATTNSDRLQPAPQWQRG